MPRNDVDSLPGASHEPDVRPASGAASGPGSAHGSDRPGGASLTELVAVMDRLLAPDGCPWDREQTLTSLVPFLVEETYEVLEAIESGDAAEHCEELGDLLMQIVFQAALRQAEGRFTIDDVIASITRKLIRRHPHVFSDASASTSEEVLVQWDAIKQAEKSAAGPRRVLDGVPVAMPALARAQKLGERAARVGFDWPDTDGSLAKVAEEIAEVKHVLARRQHETEASDASTHAGSGSTAAVDDELHHEIGDLLFAVVNLARKSGCDAESALRAASHRFTSRFGHIEDRLAERGLAPEKVSLDEMDALWNDAKERERAATASPGDKKP